ncbi:hypothetical protein [uncultured Sphingomonas sp.]|uniref:hypothetical protein n=1 Tax=uncultured Sphingomonas sp. TaxID=158754 RepID=UPI0035C9FEF1
MTAAYRFKGLGWFASCTAIVLGFYLVSLQVASERNKLDALNGRIRTAERDIRALETEFDTRANLQQLERWNGDILALSAPVAGQFVRHEAQLASVRFDGPAPLSGAEMKTAALVVPSMPAIEPIAAPVVVASIPARVPVASASTPTPARQRIAFVVAKAATTAKMVASAPKRIARPDLVRPQASVAVASDSASVSTERRPSAKPQRVAMLDGDLLSDLTSRARDEAGRR